MCHVQQLLSDVSYGSKQNRWWFHRAVLFHQLSAGIQNSSCQCVRYQTLSFLFLSGLYMYFEVLWDNVLYMTITSNVTILAFFNVWLCLVNAPLQTGIQLNCDNCGESTLPACHLAMSDASIRNFCTLTCAMSFKVTKLTKFSELYWNIFSFSKCWHNYGAPICILKLIFIHLIFFKENPTAAANPPVAPDRSHCEFFKPPGMLLCSQCQRNLDKKPKVIQKKVRWIWFF